MENKVKRRQVSTSEATMLEAASRPPPTLARRHFEVLGRWPLRQTAAATTTPPCLAAPTSQLLSCRPLTYVCMQMQSVLRSLTLRVCSAGTVGPAQQSLTAATRASLIQNSDALQGQQQLTHLKRCKTASHLRVYDIPKPTTR